MAVLSKYKWCVIIPTYNNQNTLESVIDGVLGYTNNVIVVNDGSTDKTTEILQKYPSISIINHPKNLGKGKALRNGFNKALEQGLEYAITIDSDGQHFPDDLPKFIQKLEESDGNTLLIGARNMAQEGVPKKSSFGNKFSNFWFWFETRIKLEDTQSGYRLYPISKMPKKYFTSKFEFEIESIVRAAWAGINVENIPIKVHYDLKNRISHFRPFKDFTRISILNTVLVLITVFYIRPRVLIRNLKKKGVREFLTKEVLESGDSTVRKSSAIALGVFWGIIPLWGFQSIGVISSALLLKLNKIIAFAFSNISLPPFIPFIVWASLKVGSYFVAEPVGLVPDDSFNFEFVKNHMAQYVVGSTILAIFIALFFFLVSYLILSLLSKESTVANA